MNCTFNCLIFYWETRCYVPKDGKFRKAGEYVVGLNPSCINNPSSKKLKDRRKLTNNILVIVNVNTAKYTLILFKYAGSATRIEHNDF